MLITQTIDNGDGTITAYGRSDAGNYVHVVVGRDLIANGTVYALLDQAARRIDAKAHGLKLSDTHVGNE